MSTMKNLRRLAALALMALVFFPMGGCCCDDECGTDTMAESETVQRVEVNEGRTVLGWRFFCHDDHHRPAGVWRGSFCQHQEAAETEASTHCRRWGCDIAETFVRPEY